MTRLALMAIALTAASCAAPNTKSPATSATSGVRDAISCRISIAAKPRYQSLAVHMPLAGAIDATLVQLADDHVATRPEVESLELWHQDIQICRRDLLSFAIDNEYLSVAVIVSFWEEEDKIYVGIVKRKLTWGEAQIQLRQILADALTKFSDQAIKLSAQSNSAVQAELSRRVSTLNALINILP